MQFTTSLIAALAAFAPLASASMMIPEGAADGMYAAETTDDGTITKVTFTALGSETAVEITGAELETFKAGPSEALQARHPRQLTKRTIHCDGGNYHPNYDAPVAPWRDYCGNGRQLSGKVLSYSREGAVAYMCNYNSGAVTTCYSSGIHNSFSAISNTCGLNYGGWNADGSNVNWGRRIVGQSFC